MINIFNKKQKNIRGFTLVEALVSISILVMAVTGAFTAAQSGISSSIFSKNQIIAFYLAGEGVEQIRNMRDENGLKGNNWLSGIAGIGAGYPCDDGKVCQVDALTTEKKRCDSDVCPNLRLDPIHGFYGYSISYASTTIFNRQIRMKRINDDEWQISVIVDWSNKGITRKFEIRENIMNWQ